MIVTSQPLSYTYLKTLNVYFRLMIRKYFWSHLQDRLLFFFKGTNCCQLLLVLPHKHLVLAKLFAHMFNVKCVLAVFNLLLLFFNIDHTVRPLRVMDVYKFRQDRWVINNFLEMMWKNSLASVILPLIVSFLSWSVWWPSSNLVFCSSRHFIVFNLLFLIIYKVAVSLTILLLIFIT